MCLRGNEEASLAGGRGGTMRWDQSWEGFTLKAVEAGIKRECSEGEGQDES